jgi:hypothetical protein
MVSQKNRLIKQAVFCVRQKQNQLLGHFLFENRLSRRSFNSTGSTLVSVRSRICFAFAHRGAGSQGNSRANQAKREEFVHSIPLSFGFLRVVVQAVFSRE